MSTYSEIIKKNKTIFLPDIGTFFNQDISKALNVIEKLSELDIPIIKAEILHDKNICLETKLNESYYSNKKKKFINENYRKLIERKVISLKDYARIFTSIKDQKKDAIVSVYDFKGADFAIDFDMVALKIASSNITHKPLIEYVAKTDKPILLDTGHSSLEEISRAINWINDLGRNDITILHSPLGPPSDISEHNLNFMKTLGGSFGLPYGLSDHHIGNEMLFAATAMGASVVEKGVCEDSLGDEQDRSHAINLSSVNDVVKNISNISHAMGNGIRSLPRNREKYISRMGLIANKDLKIGNKIYKKDIAYAFPVVGIPVEDIDQIISKQIKRNISKGSPIYYHDIEC